MPAVSTHIHIATQKSPSLQNTLGVPASSTCFLDLIGNVLEEQNGKPIAASACPHAWGNNDWNGLLCHQCIKVCIECLRHLLSTTRYLINSSGDYNILWNVISLTLPGTTNHLGGEPTVLLLLLLLHCDDLCVLWVMLMGVSVLPLS